MWLMFEGKVLEASRTLSAYGIRGRSTIQVVPRGRGGSSAQTVGWRQSVRKSEFQVSSTHLVKILLVTVEAD